MADETKRIVDLTESNTADSSIYLPTDSSSAGTNKIAAPTLVDNAPATFTTSDVAAANATAYTDPGVMTSGENRKTLLQKISQMAKNVKYLYKMLGTTDISSLGGGTVTGALSTLNTNIGTHSTAINKLNTDLAYLSGLRHKNLGTQPTSEQLAKIAAGDFSDFWNGDYWSYGGRIFRVWDNTDFMFRRGDTEFRKHGLIIMCDANLIAADGQTHYMNDTDTTEGGYKSTKYRSTYKAQCKSIIEAWCGASHVATYRGLISNATSNGKASGWEWADCDVELPCEVNMYGHNAWSESTIGGSGYNIGSFWGQFRLAELEPSNVVNRANCWLQDVVSASYFAYVNYSGNATNNNASFTFVGFRPFFILV